MFHGTAEPGVPSHEYSFVTDSAELDAEVAAGYQGCRVTITKATRASAVFSQRLQRQRPEGAQALVEFLKKFEAEHTK